MSERDNFDLGYAQGYEDGKQEILRMKCNICKAEDNQNKWIPITTRKLTKEEKEKEAEKYGMEPEDFDDAWVFTCPLPDIDQEVLVTTKIWGNVVIDTFVDDGEGASYFEDHYDEDELLAWMPLPEPYKDPLDHSDEPIRCKAENCSPEGCKHCAGYEPIDFGGDT